jgi:hypothetical protein
MGKIPAEITAELDLPNPKSYTRHSFRVTSATMLVDTRISITNLKRQGGWKSDSVVERYLRESKKMKSENAALITGIQQNQSITLSPSPQSASTAVQFKNASFHNCIFNISQ